MDFIPIVDSEYRMTVAKALSSLNNDVNSKIWTIISVPRTPDAPRKPRLTRRSPGRKILDRLKMRGKCVG